MRDIKILCALLVVITMSFLLVGYLQFEETRQLTERIKIMEDTLHDIYNPSGDDEPFFTVIR